VKTLNLPEDQFTRLERLRAAQGWTLEELIDAALDALEDDEWSAEELEGISAGLEDARDGRVMSGAEAFERLKSRQSS
jgi:predicted transcriptional regulator